MSTEHLIANHCTEQSLRMVVFCIGDIRCGLDISHIQEIKRPGDVTPVHRAPPAVRGVVNIRGTIVTIIDIRSCMGYAAIGTDAQTRVVVVNHAAESVGLMVDNVEDVIEVNATDIHPTPATFNQVIAPFFSGIFKSDHQLIAIIDIAPLLNATVAPDSIGVGAALADGPVTAAF
jgi:purine-binding chemotaxis protein CheW